MWSENFIPEVEREAIVRRDQKTLSLKLKEKHKFDMIRNFIPEVERTAIFQCDQKNLSLKLKEKQ
jgi:hypothetical protein